MGWTDNRFLLVGAALIVDEVTSTCFFSPETADPSRLSFSVTSYNAAVLATFVAGIITTFLLVRYSPFSDLVPWAKAGQAGLKNLLHYADMCLSALLEDVVTLIGMPFIQLVASLHAVIFHKDALVQYEDASIRFSLKYGWVYAVICITTFLCLRSFKHLGLTTFVLTLLRMFSVLLFEPIIWVCLGRTFSPVMWALLMPILM